MWARGARCRPLRDGRYAASKQSRRASSDEGAPPGRVKGPRLTVHAVLAVETMNTAGQPRQHAEADFGKMGDAGQGAGWT